MGAIKRFIRKVKRNRAFKHFHKYCLHIPCTSCPYFKDDGQNGICMLAVDLGLEGLQ